MLVGSCSFASAAGGHADGTTVTVIADTPQSFSFSLSISGHPAVSSVSGSALTVPSGPVTFNVSNPISNINSHNFKVCSTPLTASVIAKPALELPNSCSGMQTPMLAPGGADATLTIDLTPGTYEYLSTAGGPPKTNDASAGMKGKLTVIGAAPTAARLTINATPNPIVMGDQVLIYGQLTGANPAGQTIVLHTRVNGGGGFTVGQTTATNATGFYEFTASAGVVTSNRSWFTTLSGAGTARSRTVHEHVAPTLTLASSAPTGETKRPLTFSGSIAPAGVHSGERVFLQKQTGGGGTDWKMIGQAVIDASSNYSITRSFLVPGALDLRVLFTGDARNAKATSDPVTVLIQQTEQPTFTINTSAPTIAVGGAVTISGRLYAPGSTTAPMPATSVSLWGHQSGGKYAPIAATVTGADGSYSFTETPTHNETYRVRTTAKKPLRLTAQLFEGVRDAVTISASSTSSLVGSTVTLTGTVTPSKAGDAIDLEELDTGGGYHVLETGRVNGTSTYAFSVTFGDLGTKTFRVVIPGDATNVNGVSPTVAIAVSLPPVTSLPPAS